MIISKTPYRVSLLGGGSDLPAYFKKNGGEVIGFAINQYSYIFLKKTSQILDYKYRIIYSKEEIASKLQKIFHPSVREVLKYYNYNSGIELSHSGDLPALSGMGSSSSFTVGLSNIIRTIQKKTHDKYTLAAEAIDIEQNKIKEAVGSQDQIFATFGGINRIEFKKNGDFNITRLNLKKKSLKLLEESSILVFTGKVRIASLIEKKKIISIKSIPNKQSDIGILKTMVNEGFEILNHTNLNLKDLGQLLDSSWKIKKNLTDDITNEQLDNLYENGINLGAYGGKLLGAGGGGFFYFLVPQSKKENFKKKIGYKTIDISLDFKGSEIIFNQKN
jgi:D-glycero-alpha-D-manno-heptose-7-phosphate kinase